MVSFSFLFGKAWLRLILPIGLATATALASYSNKNRPFAAMKDSSNYEAKPEMEMKMPKIDNKLIVNNNTGTIYVELVPPFVVNTWPFVGATQAASQVLAANGKALDAVEVGVNWCELAQCDGTVGFGGSPAEDGSVFLDAMIIDGDTHRVGSVLNLPNVKKAISVARAVMERTKHSILTGEAAGKFASEMQFAVDPNGLRTPESDAKWEQWKANNCQPNFRQNVTPDASTSCGPYKPRKMYKAEPIRKFKIEGHDTIGMIAVDASGRLAVGTSTNGLAFKVPGRVADSAIPGAGGYADRNIGGAVATGDGDVIVAYAPSAIALERVATLRPDLAAASSLSRMSSYGTPYSAALVVATPQGHVGAACVGFSSFTLSYWDSLSKTTRTTVVNCPPSFGSLRP